MQVQEGQKELRAKRAKLGRLKALYKLLSGQAEQIAATNGFLVDIVEATLSTKGELRVYLSLGEISNEWRR